MTTVEIILKNGKEFSIECENFTVEINKFTGHLQSYKATGIKNNLPLYLDIEEVVAIIQK